MSPDEPLIAGVELGGTKCIAVVARGRQLLKSARWPTERPAATLGAIADQLDRWREEAPFEAVGLASFGPLDLNPASPRFGRIVNTPKPGWSDVDVRSAFSSRFHLPLGFDTDVAGPALAEARWGGSARCDVHVYLTIGTGVGAGIVVDGRILHGAAHPEVGHVRVRRDPFDPFPGTCPIHGDCLEGLVSGPAISARAGEPVDHLDPRDPVWDLVGEELGELMVMLILTLSPQRIVIGGGVAHNRPLLLARIQTATAERLNGYLAGQAGHELQRTIVASQLGSDVGPLGAIALGLEAFRQAADGSGTLR